MSFQLLAFVQNPLTLIKRFRFNQSLRESTKKPINTLGNQKRGKTWGNILLMDHILKVQKPNIEGLTNFAKKESEREKRKEKRRKNNSS
jgi:hypothetical protein